jgi:hypothetical protein
MKVFNSMDTDIQEPRYRVIKYNDFFRYWKTLGIKSQ